MTFHHDTFEGLSIFDLEGRRAAAEYELSQVEKAYPNSPSLPRMREHLEELSMAITLSGQHMGD